MAVVVRPEDVQQFITAAAKENLLAVVVAKVTEKPNLVMYWNGETIVDIERSFLDTNGVRVVVDAKVVDAQEVLPGQAVTSEASLEQDLKSLLSDLNHTSQKGLQTIFDSSVGRVLLLIILSAGATKSRRLRLLCRNCQLSMARLRRSL